MTLEADLPTIEVLSAGTWETLLTVHYLRSDGPFGASPIRSIDATPRELSRAAGRFRLSPEQAAQRFLKSFSPSYDVPEVLRGFRRPPATPDTPGYFRYLVLSAYVPAIALDEEATRNFRFRLGQILELPGAVENISELPLLWKRLVQWCDARRAEGKPYRRLILPDPGSWTLVGYSNRLAFPSWRDSGRLARRIEDLGPSNVAAPKNAIALLKHEIEFGGYSPPMREAFEDFRVRFQRGERLLAEHRFWRLLDEVRANSERTLGRKDRTLQSSLTLTIGIDEADIELDFVVGAGTELLNGLSVMRRVSGPPEAVLHQIRKIAADLVMVSQDIGKAASAGLMLFEQQTWGTWRFVRASSVRAEAMALIRVDHVGRVNKLGIASRPVSDSWSISKILSPVVVTDLVGALLGIPTITDDNELTSVAIIDAVRTGAAMLGRPGTLPRIRVTAFAEVRLIPAHEARGSLGVEPDRSVLGQNGTWKFTSDAPVGGSWRLLAQEGVSTDSDEAELLLRFDERALEHLELTDPEQSPNRLEHEAEMLASRSGTLHVRRRLTENKSTANPRLDDLLEAIYAGGRSGWSEADLVPLIRRVLPFESAPKVFDVIHLLQAAGWIEPRLLTQWRGRRWFLRRPRLVAIRQDDEIALVLDGSTPEVVRERFYSIVTQQGGRVEGRSACGDWGLPMLVARVADPSNVGSILGFEIEEASSMQADPAPACWPVETRSLTNRVLASSWCWQSGSFKTNLEPISTAVELQRHIRSRGDDRDVYSVASGDTAALLFTSRTIAILEAYRRAGKSLFRKDQTYLVRSTQDGYLPLSAIRWLRFLHLANPGVLHVAGQPHTIAYPIDDVSLASLSRWFGPAVAGTPSKRPDQRLSIGIARHRAHRPRLVWRDSLHDERSDRVENP